MISEVTNVSDITAKNLASYLRISEPSKEELNELNTFLNISIEYIKGYTGIEDLDKFNDFVGAVLVLVQDMYDNKTLYLDKNNINKTVENILSMHSINLL